jgi:hypothetical protein
MSIRFRRHADEPIFFAGVQVVETRDRRHVGRPDNVSVNVI